MILVIMIIIIFLIIIYMNSDTKETFTLNTLDSLDTPIDSQTLNEIDIRMLYRLVGVYTNFVVDRFNKLKYLSYLEPSPKIGETLCYKIKCPSWLENVRCWKCT